MTSTGRTASFSAITVGHGGPRRTRRVAWQVQCICSDPPYGIKFNSNWQVSTLSRDVKDGKADRRLARARRLRPLRYVEGWHPLYLTYLRDRLTVARGLLTESGSIFVQIGGENVHLFGR